MPATGVRTRGSSLTASGCPYVLPLTVSLTVYCPGNTHGDVGAGAVLCATAAIGYSGRRPGTGGYRISHRKRCMPASVESVCAGRGQYLGIASIGSIGSTGSLLEYFRTSLPAASVISMVTGPA